MKKLFILGATLATLAMMACSSSTTSASTISSCLATKAGKNVLCITSTTGKVMTDASCKADNSTASDTTIVSAVTAVSSCPSGSISSCDAKDSTKKVVGKMYTYQKIDFMGSPTDLCVLMSSTAAGN